MLCNIITNKPIWTYWHLLQNCGVLLTYNTYFWQQLTIHKLCYKNGNGCQYYHILDNIDDLLTIVLPHISIYIKIYQVNKIYGKGVVLQVCKLKYSPPSDDHTKSAFENTNLDSLTFKNIIAVL